MMGNYDLIALDIDGTLLDSRLALPRANRDAVRRAAEAGKYVALSTGRCLSEVREVAAALPEIRYVICESGSCVYDRKYDHTLHVDPVPPEEVRYILAHMAGERAAIQVFHENQSYFDQPNAGFAEACDVGLYRESFRRSAVFDERLFERYGERPFRIEKLNLYFETEAGRSRMLEKLAGRPLKLAPSIGHMVEVVSALADKGRGLRMLCAHLGVDVARAIAVGDSVNDVEILRAAGLSAAMGNACAEAKAAADVIAPDCDHDGVAWVIENYLLN